MKAIRVGMLIATCVATIALPGQANALITKYNPFGNGGGCGLFGADPNDGYSHWIVWYDASGNNCQWELVTSSSSLSDAVEIFGAEGDDYLIVASYTFTNQCGGFSLTTPNFNNNPVYLIGGGGNDTLDQGTASGFSSGGSGNDLMMSYRASSSLYGDSGNDRMFGLATSGSGSGATISGYTGNDCICVNSGITAASVSCGGPGDNDQWRGPGTRPADCESTASETTCDFACWGWTG